MRHDTAVIVNTITIPNSGLHVLDTNASHDLVITPGSDLSADRILTITTGDAARTITLSGNPTLSDWFDQSVKQAASPTFAGETIGSLAGVLKGTAGVVGAITNGTANQVLGMDAAGTGYEYKTLTAGTGITVSHATNAATVATNGATSKAINQGAHGFAVGDVLKFAGGVYAKAQADTAANAEVVGIVGSVEGAADFTIVTNGYVSGLSGLTANTLYYLSGSSAGALTATAPTTEGYINKPVFFATSTTTGYFINYRGVSVTTSTSYYQAFVNGDLAAGVLTVNHNLGHKYCTVQVFDNSDILILPDTITLSSTTALAVDLTSYGTISGTWHAVVLDIGSQLTTPVAVTSGGTGLATIASGAIPYASALNTIAALGIGAANYKMFTNAAGTFPEWASGIKLWYAPYNVATTSDATVIPVTGIGFKPGAMIVAATIAGTKNLNIGVTDGTNVYHIRDDSPFGGTADTYDWVTATLVDGAVDSSNTFAFTLNSFDSDGFTWTFNKTGSPTGTVKVFALIFR